VKDRGIPGQLLRALATSKPGGTFLCLGADAGEAATRVLEGMDLSSGLVVLVQGADEETALERAFERDLRVSVHRQDAQAFLRDVHAHRFDLIADSSDGERAAIARLALELLRAGGLYVASGAGNALEKIFAQGAAASDPSTPQLRADAFALARLDGSGDLMLVSRRPERPQPRRRAR
jgi:predicted O-methyltransferase YrrM